MKIYQSIIAAMSVYASTINAEAFEPKKNSDYSKEEYINALSETFQAPKDSIERAIEKIKGSSYIKTQKENIDKLSRHKLLGIDLGGTLLAQENLSSRFIMELLNDKAIIKIDPSLPEQIQVLQELDLHAVGYKHPLEYTETILKKYLERYPDAIQHILNQLIYK